MELYRENALVLILPCDLKQNLSFLFLLHFCCHSNSKMAASRVFSFTDVPETYLKEKKKLLEYLYKINEIKILKSGCHQWMRACSGRTRCRRILKRGYGVMKLTYDGKSHTVFVHRLVYYLHHRKDCTPGTEISHLCHKTDCINLSHLNMEPHAVNMQRQKCKEQRSCTMHGVHPACIFP